MNVAQSPEYRRLNRLAAAYNKKARNLAIRSRVTGFDLLLIEVENPHCMYCGVGLEEGQGTFDHVVPLDKGGQNNALNIVRCCLTCNREKYTKSPGELEQHRAREVVCARPGCGKVYKPRWAEYEAGRARLCSRRCAALMRWQRERTVAQ